jgi:pyruvate dehydrogenase E2 component (dihydrolipoamide acetyltransferase)
MSSKQIQVPDIGDFDAVEVIEVLVAAGDRIEAEQSLITLESDKATMEVPAPEAGVIAKVLVKVGDQVSEGTVIFEFMAAEAAETAAASAPVIEAPQPPAASEEVPQVPVLAASQHRIHQVEADPAPVQRPDIDPEGHRLAHASPAVRRFARELGVDLSLLKGSGRNERILKEDVQAFVKQVVNAEPAAAPAAALTTTGIPPIPAQDFSRYGPVEERPMSRIRKISGPHLHRSWLNVPHVTQFDEADITELEAFRKAEKVAAEQRGVKLTPLAFMVKASASALREFPDFNSSLSAAGDALIIKDYVNIGVAVDTPQGLVVPVIRDADRKGVFEIARDLAAVSTKARDGKLAPTDMQGGTFTISSLGGIGGTAFTPIVNAPEVAILGVSRSSIKPVWDGKAFQPRLMLPLSLSYDHRAIDGASGARFITRLSELLGDIRRLVL